MTFGRPWFFNRIGSQMTILVLVSLLAIHAVITASLFIGHRGDSRGPPDDGRGQFITAVRLAAATSPADRAKLLASMAQAIPQMDIRLAAAMPDSSARADPRLRHLGEHLGPHFDVATFDAPPNTEVLAIAVRLPDGAVLTARLPPRIEPPMLGGPIVSTVLFVIVSGTLLGIWATRALRRPLSGLAEAAEAFNIDGVAAGKLPERGPEEIRAVAKAFNRMSDRVKALVGDRTRMLAAMGHDLRTPITRLRLRSEFIGDSELRRQMLRDLDQMNAMTEGVLVFLRDGQAHEPATAVDVASILQTICDQFGDLGYDVAYQGPDRVVLQARPGELRRAVVNLVENAVRYGKHVVVRLAAGDMSTCIAVEDDGPGIIDASKDAMLEAFVRGDDARTMDDRAGFGLGLAIARAAAEAHGGTLTLHDREPHGLSARITLPAAWFNAAKVA